MSYRIVRKLGLVHTPTQRRDQRRFGVPLGGFWDPDLAQLCSRYARVSLDRCIEIANGEVELEFQDSCHLVVMGDGPASQTELNFLRNVKAGDRVVLSAAYACACIGVGSAADRTLAPLPKPSEAIQYVPHTESLPDNPLQVSPASSRMGVRLDGLAPNPMPESPSEPAAPGVIQQTPSGQLIVLGPDGPTIGGYRKVGFVIQSDLRTLAYLRAGTFVRLKAVDLESAMTADNDWSEFCQRRLRSV